MKTPDLRKVIPMARTITITLDVVIADDADPEYICDELFNHLCSTDEEDTPGIETFDTYGWIESK